MRICIYGAGAIGGYLGAQLALAGEEVTLIARGPHLKAMQIHGVKLCIRGEEQVVHPTCTDDPAEVGPQDYVIITLKAPSIPGIVDAIQPLLGPETAVLTAYNGIPFWYFYRLEGARRDHRLESVDPGGEQWPRPRTGGGRNTKTLNTAGENANPVVRRISAKSVSVSGPRKKLDPTM